MTPPEKEEEKIAPVAEVRSESSGSNDSSVHRPEEDIANKPQLKVRPIGSRASADSPKPTVRGGTLFRSPEKPSASWAAEAPPPDVLTEDAVPKKAAPAAQEAAEVRFPYATHRTAPPDEKAEKAELAALTGPKAEREISTGLVLGLALIAVALVSGVFTVRLMKKVGALEQRLSKLERPDARATVTSPQAPVAKAQPASKPGLRETRTRTVSVGHSR
jgi:hypothetical protein